MDSVCVNFCFKVKKNKFSKYLMCNKMSKYLMWNRKAYIKPHKEFEKIKQTKANFAKNIQIWQFLCVFSL